MLVAWKGKGLNFFYSKFSIFSASVNNRKKAQRFEVKLSFLQKYDHTKILKP